MNVFVLTTAVVLAIFYIGNKPVDYSTIETQRDKIRDTGAAFFVVATIFFCFVSGQRFCIGDTVTYMDYFTDNNSTIAECLSDFSIGKEWLFEFYMVFIKNTITSDPRVYIEITSFITIIPIMYFYYSYSGDMKFAFYLFVTSGCWEHSMNGLRQYLASSLLLLSVAWIYKKRWYLYFPFVFIISQIHTSAYIFFILYFILNKPAYSKFTKGLLIFSVLLAISSPITGSFINNLLFSATEYGNKYNNSDWDYGINIFRVIVMAMPIIVSYINKDVMKDKYKYYNIVFNMGLFCCLTTLLGVFTTVFARLNLYFECYNVILLVWNINEMIKDKRYRWIKAVACICYLLYFLYQMLVTYGMRWHEDYLFFVNNWLERSWI